MKTGNDEKDPFKDLKTVKSTTSNMKNKKAKNSRRGDVFRFQEKQV